MSGMRLADFGALDKRLVPGFVTACEFDGEARTITFANGTIARELLVTSDSDHRRLVYAIVGERVKHYSAAAQVFDDGKDGTRFNWTIDLLAERACALHQRPDGPWRGGDAEGAGQEGGVTNVDQRDLPGQARQ